MSLFIFRKNLSYEILLPYFGSGTVISQYLPTYWLAFKALYMNLFLVGRPLLNLWKFNLETFGLMSDIFAF